MSLSLRRQTTAARGKSHDSSISCKRHLKHQQSPGVCSLCLREKLSQIFVGSTSSSTSSSSSSSFSSGLHRYSSSSSSSSLSPYCSSSSGSSMASPVHRYGFDGDKMLGRRRSIGFIPRNESTGSGFWSRLMPIWKDTRR